MAILSIELFAHLDAGDRRSWVGDQDERPLSDLGRRQAQRLCDAIGQQPLDALYSSPALRTRESIEPLATRFGLPVTILTGLRPTDDWLPPPVWRNPRITANDPLGGAYAAGYAMQALRTMRDEHPDGRVAACTHGDVLPSLIVYLIGAYGLDLPAPHTTRGGWYTIVIEGEDLRVEHRDVLPGFPLA